MRIRSGADVESILRHIRAGILLLRLHVAPETRYRFEFPFRSEMPRALQTNGNPYLRSMMYEVGLSMPNAARSGSAPPSPSDRHLFSPQYLKPYLAATLVEPRLDAVQPSQWTEVSKDNELMRALLRTYLLNEYQWLPCFQKDDFLDDMVSGSRQYCSPLLVNTVLAFACLGAKKSLPTLQAAILINVLFNMHVMDKIARPYVEQAVAIAHELDLFGSEGWSRDGKGRNSREFTRWCLYFWTRYSEFFIKYPLDDTPYRVNYGDFFKAKCELTMIINHLVGFLFNKEGIKDPRTPERLIKQLPTWYAALPVSMQPRNIVFPSQLKAQVCFETIMRLYYLRYGYGGADSYFTYDLVILSFIAQANLKALPPSSLPPTSPSSTSTLDLDSIRSTLILAAKGLHLQGSSYQLPLTIFHLVQSMRPEDAELMHRYANVKVESKKEVEGRAEHKRS
ncbi:hypothetical protein K458DRAFT_476818 [Lentithecium fluviatile CBS 122367]|uniref:Transcription factor domain-containing protein n=1 Tax=Lentithecium fluviatile CBS 122367 TaxID=1168545 RepID=A0A6G1J840_9PLEO|nr:hypothetical protein K458DRAFT_476818 [Lentithecium fluviatile CBS 122367]